MTVDLSKGQGERDKGKKAYSLQIIPNHVISCYFIGQHIDSHTFYIISNNQMLKCKPTKFCAFRISLCIPHWQSCISESFSKVNAKRILTGSVECDGLVVSECIYHYIKAIGHNAALQPKHKSHSFPLWFKLQCSKLSKFSFIQLDGIYRILNKIYCPHEFVHSY